MVDDGSVEVEVDSARFSVEILSGQVEIFVDEVSDSRDSLVDRVSLAGNHYRALDELSAKHGAFLVGRPCKTVLRLRAQVHSSILQTLDSPEGRVPREMREVEAYFASLCDGHIEVLNDVVRRYRLATYDYHAHDLSPADIPVWLVATAGGRACVVNLVPSNLWDQKPTSIDVATGAPPRDFMFASLETLASTHCAEASPGEWDLLDSRCLMERGDYTGAIRRVVTAIEAVLEWSFERDLARFYSEGEVARRVRATKMNFRGRLQAWKELAGVELPDFLETSLFEARKIRHEIVHDGRRISFEERHLAQQCVDTGRWVFNRIERRADRIAVRENINSLRSAGRTLLAPRFPTTIEVGGVRVLMPDRPTKTSAA